MKTSISTLAVTVFGAIAFPGSAVAQNSDGDVRCVVVANIFALNEKEPAKKQIAAAAGLYYLGRADARIPAARFKSAVVAEQKLLNAQNAGPAMTGCVQSFIARQRALKALGRELAPQRSGK